MARGMGKETQSGLGYWTAFVKQRFRWLSAREQILASLFLAALLAIWVSMQWDRHIVIWDEIRAANQRSQLQRMLIDRAPEIDSEFQSLLTQIDLEELPSRDQVNGDIDALARRFNFDMQMGSPKTQPGSPLSFHTYQLIVKKAPYERLYEFTSRLKQEFAYVSLRHVRMQADKRTGTVDATYELKSIEYTP